MIILRRLIVVTGLLLTLLDDSTAQAGTATLSWNVPTTNADGTPLTDLAGYKVYYGSVSVAYTQVVDVGLTGSPSAPSYILNNLADGDTYYFAVTAYNSSGSESGYSSEVSKAFPGSPTTTIIPTTTTTRPTTTTIRPTTTTTTSTTTTTRPTTTTTTSTTTTTRPTTTTTTTRPTTTTTSTTTTTRPTTTTTSTTTTTRPTTTTTTSTTSTSTTTTTLISQDTLPPVIFTIAALDITDTEAEIDWSTNEASTSLVEYGTTAAYGFVTSLSSTRVTRHGKPVDGLQAATTYHYRISSADATGNLAISGDNTFTTPEAPGAPLSIISGVAATRIKSTSAVINWNTDETATSQVEYGTDSSYGLSSVPDSALLTGHRQAITGLLSNTLYHYRVRSIDANGNPSVSGDYVFTTGDSAYSTPPADVQNFNADLENQTIILRWDGPSDPNFTGVRIRYRTDRFPTDINDGTLLGDFTQLPGETITTNHAGLQNGATYYYSASSYDGHGNYQSTMHASATAIFSSADFSGSIGGGCGMVFPTDGRPSGPGQAADMTGLLTVLVFLWIRRKIRILKSREFYRLSPAGITDFAR